MGRRKLQQSNTNLHKGLFANRREGVDRLVVSIKEFLNFNSKLCMKPTGLRLFFYFLKYVCCISPDFSDLPDMTDEYID